MKIIWILTLTALLPGCAGPQQTSEKYTVEQELALGNPHEGEVIYATSRAIDIAQMALQQKGVDYAERGVMVSFCDGIYTVTFEKPHNAYDACDFKVDIDAENSKILAVVTEK